MTRTEVRQRSAGDIDPSGYATAVLNILEDFADERERLADTQRAMLNILEDFEEEKTKVERANQHLSTEVAERRRTERWLEAVRETASAILGGTGADEVLQLIAARARDLVGADLATVMTPVAGGAELRISAADGAHAAGIRGILLPLQGSISGEVIRGQHPIVIADAAADTRAYQAAVSASRTGPSVCVPLSVRGVAFGTLGVSNTVGGRAFGDDDVRLLESFAAQASLGLEYTRTQRELLRLSVVEDRERIARELHDGVIQALFAVGLSLQATAGMLADSRASARLQDVVNEVDRVIGDLRNYIFGLRPGVLAQGRVLEALEQLAHEFQAGTGVTTVVEVDETLEHPVAANSVHIVQLTREALSNVGRHAGAQTCRVSLLRQGSTAVLEIDDDGGGFDVEAVRSGGMGLGNLESRARSIGGRLQIASVSGEGTTVRVTIPV